MSRPLLLAAVLLALAPVALAGCGDDDTDTDTAATTASTSSTTEDGATPPADRTVTKTTPFGSPDGDIGCVIGRRSVRCDVADPDWKPPKAPASCKLDYGQGITVDAGGAPEFVCAGDTTLGAGQPVPYGGSISAGLLRCESERSGMTCRDTETGRGFALSKRRYKLL